MDSSCSSSNLNCSFKAVHVFSLDVTSSHLHLWHRFFYLLWFELRSSELLEYFFHLGEFWFPRRSPSSVSSVSGFGFSLELSLILRQPHNSAFPNQKTRNHMTQKWMKKKLHIGFGCKVCIPFHQKIKPKGGPGNTLSSAHNQQWQQQALVLGALQLKLLIQMGNKSNLS